MMQIKIKRCASSLLISAYENGKWSDITIINGAKEYRVHKLVLSTAIDYFDKMFSSGLSEATNQVIKFEHPAIAFELIIKWAYSFDIFITEKNAIDLFHLADDMNITEIKAECLNFLWNTLSDPDSALQDIELWLNEIDTEETSKVVDKFISSNFCDIVHTESFLDYEIETVIYMISLNDLNIVDEIQVFEAVIRWVQVDVENRSTHLLKLLKKVHWSDINGAQFMNKLDKWPWIMKYEKVRPVIMAAIEFICYKSLKTVRIKGFDFKPRQKSTYSLYCILELDDVNIMLKNIEKPGSIAFKLSENPDITVAKFGDSYVTQHCIDSDVVIRIDWKNKTHLLYDDIDCKFMQLYDRLFEFDANERKVYCVTKYHFEFALMPDIDICPHTVTHHKGLFYLTYIVDVNLPPIACTLSGNAIEPPQNEVLPSENTNTSPLLKYELHVKQLNNEKNVWQDIASHEIITPEKIKLLKSTVFHDSIVIFIDYLPIIIYNFDSNTFEEYDNSEMTLDLGDVSDLHFVHHYSKLMIYHRDECKGPYKQTTLQMNDGKPAFVNNSELDSLSSSQNVLGFLSLDELDVLDNYG